MTLIVSVDGGASGCRLAAFSLSGDVLARVVVDEHASLSLGVVAAWSHINEGLQALRKQLNVEAHWQPDKLSLGLAGSRDAKKANELRALVPPHIDVLLNTDGYAQLMGASGGKPGICLAVGTGSVIHWQGTDHIVHTAGGWGFPAGDQGSGAWLGMRLLQIYVAHRDGHTSSSTLMGAVEKRIGTGSSSIVAWTTEKRPGVMAQLAPLVFDAADDNDPAAGALIDEAVAHCMQLITLAPADLPVYVVGGVGLRLRPALASFVGERLCSPHNDALRGLWDLATIQPTLNK